MARIIDYPNESNGQIGISGNEKVTLGELEMDSGKRVVYANVQLNMREHLKILGYLDNRSYLFGIIKRKKIVIAPESEIGELKRFVREKLGWEGQISTLD